MRGLAPSGSSPTPSQGGVGCFSAGEGQHPVEAHHPHRNRIAPPRSGGRMTYTACWTKGNLAVLDCLNFPPLVPGHARLNLEVTSKSKPDRQMEEIPPAMANSSNFPVPLPAESEASSRSTGGVGARDEAQEGKPTPKSGKPRNTSGTPAAGDSILDRRKPVEMGGLEASGGQVSPQLQPAQFLTE